MVVNLLFQGNKFNLMARIVTITFNPCIDKSTTIDALVPEKKLRGSLPRFEPGGGGLNVARAIKKLGGDALAIYPSGGYSGKFLQKLVEHEGITSKVVEIRNHTRENLIVMDRSTNQQYRFGMPGPQIEESEWMQCLQLVEQEKDAAFIVASGSLAVGMPLDIYARIGAIARKNGAKLIVDTSGDALKQAVNEGVYLIKPNLAELSSLVGREEVVADMVDDVAMELINQGKCEAMVVSLGAAGAMLVSRDEVIQMVPPVVKRRSTVGAGDSMVAGMVLCLSQGRSLKDALRFGIACGTAATLNEGTELCHKADVEKLYPMVRSMAVQ
jgi:6-phosphofructokinase 2